MNKLLPYFKKIATFVFFVFIFVTFFNGYTSTAPAKRKFKHLGEGFVDLTEKEEVQEEGPIKDILKDKRLKKWAEWWKKCSPKLDLTAMEDEVAAAIFDKPLPAMTAEQIGAGPAKMFYTKSPDGRYHVNPYWGRLVYKGEGKDAAPYIEIPCGVALYDVKDKKGKNILECSALEGMDDAFWVGKDKLALMGYESVSRQMNVECETVESCISPAVWIVNLKNNSMYEYRDGVIKRQACDVGGYLKTRLPNFFNEDKK